MYGKLGGQVSWRGEWRKGKEHKSGDQPDVNSIWLWARQGWALGRSNVQLSDQTSSRGS